MPSLVWTDDLQPAVRQPGLRCDFRDLSDQTKLYQASWSWPNHARAMCQAQCKSIGLGDATGTMHMFVRFRGLGQIKWVGRRVQTHKSAPNLQQTPWAGTWREALTPWAEAGVEPATGDLGRRDICTVIAALVSTHGCASHVV